MPDEKAGKSNLPQRDRQAIERGMRTHGRVLIAWLTKKFGDADLAQDLAQETYLRIWQYAERHEIDNLKPLLFKTAANLAANEFRSRGRWRASGTSDTGTGETGDIEDLACDAPSPERTALAKDEAKASLAAIGRLPEKQRRAFVMNRFEGKNYTEIAKTLQVSVSSVEKYIMAALTVLRAASEDDNDGANVVSFSSTRGIGGHG